MYRVASDNNAEVGFNYTSVLVKDQATWEILLTGGPSDAGMYKICGDEHTSKFVCTAEVGKGAEPVNNRFSSWLLRHYRLGHPSSKILSQVFHDCNLKPIPRNKNESVNGPNFCESCQFGKPHALPFKLSNTTASKPLELIHTDLWGRPPFNP